MTRAPEQITIDGRTEAITPAPLGDRQRVVLALVQQRHPDAVSADEAGAAIHAARRHHPADVTCPFCGRDGNAVLRSQRLRPYLIRRRGAPGYTLREPATSDAAEATGVGPLLDSDDPFAGLW